MPYHPLLSLEETNNLPEEISFVLNKIVDPILNDLRFLFTIKKYDQVLNDGLYHLILLSLITTIDGASQLFVPTISDKKEHDTKKKFKKFIEGNFPWNLDYSDNITKEEISEFLWKEIRNPFVHRYGMRISDKKLRLGMLYTNTDESLSKLEKLTSDRPGSEPTIEYNKSCNTISIGLESLYWAIRMAIKNSFNTPEKISLISEEIKLKKWAK